MIGYVFYRANRFVAEPGKNSDRIFLSFKHKLKTYIASAQLASQTLQNHDALDEIQREKMFRRILTNLKRLNNLIDNISAINKLGKEIKQQNFEKINLSKLIRDTCYNWENLAQINQIIEENIWIDGDRYYLTLLLNNLISNTVEFTDNQMVEIKMYCQNNKIIMQINDQSNGVSSSVKKNFLPSDSKVLDEKMTKSEVGGLSLSLTHKIAKLHDSRVWLVYNSLKSSAFTFQFSSSQL